MGPSVFRKRTEEKVAQGLAARPSAATGWIVSTREVLGKIDGTTASLADMSPLDVQRLKDSSLKDSISVVVQKSTGRGAETKISPKLTNAIVGGESGKVDSLVSFGDQTIVNTAEIVYPGSRNQSPTVIGVGRATVVGTMVNVAPVDLAKNAPTSPGSGNLTNEQVAWLMQGMENMGVFGGAGSLNHWLPSSIDPLTGKESKVGPNDGANFQGGNARTGTAMRARSEVRSLVLGGISPMPRFNLLDPVNLGGVSIPGVK